MSLKNKLSRLNNIFIRVYSNYALLVLLFAIVLGVIFIKLYSDTNTEYYSQQITRRAESVAERFRNYIVDDDYEECLSYLEVFNELEDSEIWTLSNPDAANPMNEGIVSIDIASVQLQDEFVDMIKKAFAGETQVDSFYSDIHDATTMAVSMPIIGKDKEICGALVLITTLEQMDETINSSRYLIVISAIVALIISVIFAATFARKITSPITQMRKMAKEMTEGNYKVKTGINRTDEIGDMARSIDVLSDKLLENEEIRKNMEQMRQDFFANVSHELRTPIAVVRAYTESLVDGVVTDEEKKSQYYDRMLNECKSMERLVGDLLTLSKMQNPDFEVDKEPVNLVHVFDDIVRGAAAIGDEKHINIVMNRDRDVYMMMGDYDRLRQMFMVIFDNAIKFSPENSSIYVTISNEDRLRVSIRDEGIGISSEELPNIFEKFYKSKLRQNAKGTGLGLSIAKYIAIKHGGTIEVKSSPGEGTEFIFLFNEVFEENFEGNFVGMEQN